MNLAAQSHGQPPELNKRRRGLISGMCIQVNSLN